MNTVQDWKTTAKINDPNRAEFWRKIFGTDQVPITAPIPVMVDLPGLPDALCYMLDLKAISYEQRQLLIKALAEKFNLEQDFVSANLDEMGAPILADNVLVSTTDQGILFSMIYDFGEIDDFEDLDDPEEDWEDDYWSDDWN